ncbi:hypothetical protein TNIN_63221 [Trichonephila inaurata madagascariensis]|uniref:Uncharacterized protein n=1 Tax=Trichonephila inaurata madagascariensis TaxID=2747483 RepID=A0A8X6YTA4_9ARAC|nr:hypothetical protein TNIN_63221 [Trichonephila inaurata madagascariensis]
MSRMEPEAPDFNHGFTERHRIYPEIEELDLVTSCCLELINYPDTDDNQEMKAILRTSIDNAQKKKDALMTQPARFSLDLLSTQIRPPHLVTQTSQIICSCSDLQASLIATEARIFMPANQNQLSDFQV